MEGALQVERLQAMAAAAAAAREGAEDDDWEEDAQTAGAPTWLSYDELCCLLADARVLGALTRIATEAGALDEFAEDAVVMGVLHSVCATHADAVSSQPMAVD